MSGVALIYVRRSMVRYEQDRASPERQLGNCVRVCEDNGWTYEVYQDAEAPEACGAVCCWFSACTEKGHPGGGQPFRIYGVRALLSGPSAQSLS